MAGQVAIAAVLLVGSLLLCRSFYAMLRADVGYDAANVLTATMILPDGDYTPERRLQAVGGRGHASSRDAWCHERRLYDGDAIQLGHHALVLPVAQT